MKTTFVKSVLFLAATCFFNLAYGQAAMKYAVKTEQPLMISLDEMKWIELPERPGMKLYAISGDPKSGPYELIRKVPAGTSNPLHTHSNEVTNVIISGTWYTGEDDASAKDFGPGSVIVMPANWKHVSGCRTGSDCVFYQAGEKQFDFKPVK